MKRLNIIYLIMFLVLSCNQSEKVVSKQEDKKDNSEKLLEEEELRKKSKKELRLLRNEIFARKGYVFKNEEIKNFFESKDWYQPQPNKKIELSEIEQLNVNLIKRIENDKLQCIYVIVKKIKSEFKNDNIDHLDIDTSYIPFLKEFVAEINVNAIIDSEENEYSKSYYFHKDWNWEDMDIDECEDEIFIRFGIESKTFIIQMNTCAIYKGEDEGEDDFVSEQNMIFEFKYEADCSYQFIRTSAAG